ncbi:HD domain-containing phosphohydrolase [bacterium]
MLEIILITLSISVNLILGILLFSKLKVELYIRKLFLIFIFVTSFWLILLSVASLFQSALLLKILFASWVFVLVANIMFIKVFTYQKKLSLLEIFHWLTIGAIIFMIILFDRNMIGITYDPELTIVFSLNSIIFLGFFLYSILYTLYMTGITQYLFNSILRLQARCIFIGHIGLQIILLLTLVLLPFYGCFKLIFYSFIGVLFYLGMTVYAVFRYTLFGVQSVVKRSTVHVIMGSSFTVTYLFLMFVFEFFAVKLNLKNLIFFRFLSIAFISFCYFPYLKYVQKIINKMYLTDNKYEADVRRFKEQIVSMLDIGQLVENVLKNISEIFKVKKVTLFLFDADKKKYVLKGLHGDCSNCKDMEFSSKHFLVQWLKSGNRIWIHNIKKNFDETRKGYHAAEHYLKIMEAEVCVPILVNEKLIGFMTLGEKKECETFTIQELTALNLLRLEIGVTFINASSYTELKHNILGTIESLSKALEFKDINTRGHVERVRLISIAIAEKVGCSKKDIELLNYAALLHDIGKISIDEKILNKEEKLSDEEYNIIKTHPVRGESIITPMDFLSEIKKIVRHHHEKWDGTGYPDGLKEEKVDLLARILQVADSFDAMTSYRTYKNTLSREDAIEEMHRCKGLQFDPFIVEVLKDTYRSI